MRLCRFNHRGKIEAGFYQATSIVPLVAAAQAYAAATKQSLALPSGDNLLDFLPPDGQGLAAAQKLADWVDRAGQQLPPTTWLAAGDVELLVPAPRPNKIFLLAGKAGDTLEATIERIGTLVSPVR